MASPWRLVEGEEAPSLIAVFAVTCILEAAPYYVHTHLFIRVLVYFGATPTFSKCIGVINPTRPVLPSR